MLDNCRNSALRKLKCDIKIHNFKLKNIKLTFLLNKLKKIYYIHLYLYNWKINCRLMIIVTICTIILFIIVLTMLN